MDNTHQLARYFKSDPSPYGIVKMGKLSGFTYREVIRKLRKIGFEFYRTGKGGHEIWFNPQTRLKTTISHHKEI